MKTLSEQLECAKEQLRLIRSLSGRYNDMTKDQQDYVIDCLDSVVATLEKMLMLEEIGDEMKAQYRKNNPPKTCECCGADIESGAKCENCSDPYVELIVRNDVAEELGLDKDPKWKIA